MICKQCGKNEASTNCEFMIGKEESRGMLSVEKLLVERTKFTYCEKELCAECAYEFGLKYDYGEPFPICYKHARVYFKQTQ